MFDTKPAPGVYLMNVDMFAPCGQASANFKLTVREHGKVTFEQSGRLLDIDADGGGPGLFVGQLNVK